MYGLRHSLTLATLIVVVVLLKPVFAKTLSEASHEHHQPWDQWADSYPDWVEPVAPFNVIDNIFYVGSRGIGSFLITSNEGHILIDGGLPQNAELIINSIKSLGFDIKDVQILLNTHAHFDHSGGLAELKALSGATMIASEQDRNALESGLYPGSDNVNYSAPPVRVDKTVSDGDPIKLSNIKLTANLMPGHSPGCTSWSTTVLHNDTPQEVLFFCSATVAGNRLVGPPQYPGIVKDYRRTFAKSKTMNVDVLLANHPFFSELHEKRERVLKGETDAFIHSADFPDLMQRLEADFEEKLLQQKAKLPKK